MSSRLAWAPEQDPVSKRKHNMKYVDDLRFHNSHIKERTVKRELGLLITDGVFAYCVLVQSQEKKNECGDGPPGSLHQTPPLVSTRGRHSGQPASVCSEPPGTQEEVLPSFLITLTLIPARGRAIASSCPMPTIAEPNFLPRGKRQTSSFFFR